MLKHLHSAHIFSFMKKILDGPKKQRETRKSFFVDHYYYTIYHEDLLPKKCREKSFLVKALLWSFITAFTSTRSTKTKRPSRGSQTPGKLSRKTRKISKSFTKDFQLCGVCRNKCNCVLSTIPIEY